MLSIIHAPVSATFHVQMKDSKWYEQVTNRADRLIARMEAVADA